MSTITVALPEERLVKLNEMAEQLGVVPEELVQASIEELLSRPDPNFEQAVKHVLKKNAELYRRLA
ncbi:MAG: DNA-binding protein [Chloroflexi bacterium]|nr:MAG: DNA-binding protein [Chloroflexota bacterium]